MKRQGRFTRAEILEAEERFNSGQSLYKMGRDMNRSQSSIKGHLINLGLMEYEPEPVYEYNRKGFELNLMPNTNDFYILSFLFLG